MNYRFPRGIGLIAVVMILTSLLFGCASAPRPYPVPANKEAMALFEYPSGDDQDEIVAAMFDDFDLMIVVHGVDGTLRRIFEVVSPEALHELLETKEADPAVTGLTRRNVVRLLDRMAEVRLLDYESADVLFAQMIERRDVDGLCVMLMYPRGEIIESKAADALGKLASHDALRLLGIELRLSATDPNGGSEVMEIRQVLRLSLRRAVAATIGAPLWEPSDDSPEAVLDTLNELAIWWAARYPEPVLAD